MPGCAQLLQFAIHLGLSSLGGARHVFVEHPQHPHTLLLAEATDTSVIIQNSFPYHFTLGLRKALRSILKLSHRIVIERKSDLDHTKAILPYRAGFRR